MRNCSVILYFKWVILIIGRPESFVNSREGRFWKAGLRSLLCGAKETPLILKLIKTVLRSMLLAKPFIARSAFSFYETAQRAIARCECA